MVTIITHKSNNGHLGEIMRSHLSLKHRLFASFLGMSILVVVASAAGFFYARAVDNAVIATKTGIELVERVNNLQRDWQSISESIDNLFLTRQIDTIQLSLNSKIETFGIHLRELESQPLGYRPETINENKATLKAIRTNNAETIEIINEIIRLASEGRWAIARDLRESVFATQQTRVNEEIRQIYLKVQGDIQDSFLRAAQVQNLARLISVISAFIALLLAVALGVATTRSIIHPIKKLTEASQKVSLRDFSPVEPLPQKDEIGYLSQSFALMTDWLRDSYESLEMRVAERTAELERQNLQIQVAARIARDASTSRNIDELLSRTVDLIVSRFGYYHAGIFLLDETKQYVVLRAVSGPTGSEMLSAQHKLKVGESSIVGSVALTGMPRVSLEVDQDRSHYKNPLLPETRSEIAIPMRVGEEVVGVLDVQSQFSNAFQDSDMYVLQILTDLIAVSFHNAKLNQDLQESLNELANLYGEYSQKSWANIAASSQYRGYTYDLSGVHPVIENEPDEFLPLHAEEPVVNIPLVVRGDEIGVLSVFPGDHLLSSDDINLLEDIASRISQSLESARLFNETQRRAMNERLVRQAASRMSETLDIESVLQTAVNEIYQTLHLSQLSIRLQPDLVISDKTNGNNITG